MTAPTSTKAFARQPILLGIGFILLLFIGASSLALVFRSGGDSDLIDRSYNLEIELLGLELAIRRAESAQRGLLLTADQQIYRRDYETFAKEIIPSIEALLAATKDSPRQHATIVAIEKLARQRVSELESTLRAFDANMKDVAIGIVKTGEGRQIQRRISALVQQMSDEERGRLKESIAASEQTTRWLLISIFGLIIPIIAIGVTSVILVWRSNQQRQRAQEELEATNANLETIIHYRTADLTEANEEIQRFAYIVSHDLRSPLVNIMGFTSELEELRKDLFDEIESLRTPASATLEPADGATDSGDDHTADPDSERVDTLGRDFDEAISFIKASITKMDKLIAAVLKLSREGRREFKPEYIDMTTMLRNLEKTISHQATEADATVTIHDVPPINSDRLAIEQIFSNLLDNAVKYLRKDVPGEIEVSGKATMTDVTYQIRDNGRGIDKADQVRIFELFRRAGNQDRPGEGIGLAHVRSLVRRIGGTLTVESEPGQGSTFTVTLPRRWREERRSAA